MCLQHNACASPFPASIEKQGTTPRHKTLCTRKHASTKSRRVSLSSAQKKSLALKEGGKSHRQIGADSNKHEGATLRTPKAMGACPPSTHSSWQTAMQSSLGRFDLTRVAV